VQLQTTWSADTSFQQDDVQSRYEAISRDSRYGHYVRIPERICRCLDYFKISSSRRAVKERLHSYYLFIGVVDDLIDSSQLEAGREILRQLDKPFFSDESEESHVRLVTEVFKSRIGHETYPMVVTKLEELYRAVVGERNSRTMKAYIAQRKAVGHLTAEVSYLLIQPLLKSEHKDLRRFLQKVGEIGCLVDSLIDLKADARSGLLNFRPTLKDYLNLLSETLKDGLAIFLRHARLVGVFLDAITDNLLDLRFRAG